MDRTMPDWSGPDWHPSDNELVLYMDGELPHKDSAHLCGHLEACWSCRVHLEKLEKTVSTFIDYRNQIEAPIIEPPNQWRGFDSKLYRLAEEKGRRSLLAIVRNSFTRFLFQIRPRPAFVFGSFSAILLVLFLTYLERTPSVSASELLRRAAEARASELRGIAQPVTYQKIRFRRKASASSPEDLATLEIWNDASNDRYRVSTEGWSHLYLKAESFGEHGDRSAVKDETHDQGGAKPQLIFALETTYQSNRMDWRNPLSPGSYLSWRNSLLPRNEHVERSDIPGEGRALTLTTVSNENVPEGGISKCQLVVRERDWHPIEQRLRVRTAGGETEFDLTEVTFQVVSLTVLGPFIFAEPPAHVSSANEFTRASAGRLPTSAEIDAAEIAARVALHRIQADLGEPIEILRSTPGHVEIRGLAETEQRKARLTKALENIPDVTVTIFTPEEIEGQGARAKAFRAVIRGPNADASPSGELPPVHVVMSGKAPSEEELERYFLSQPGIGSRIEAQEAARGFSNQIAFLSQSALSEAWALRRLAERYPAEEVRKLDPESRRELEELIRDNISALQSFQARHKSLLWPLLSSGTYGHPIDRASDQLRNESSSQSWPEFAAELFQTVSRIDDLTTNLFAGQSVHSPLEESVGEMQSDLALALMRLEANLNGIRKRVSGSFLRDAL
jgi:anti-sigma factor RsiW